MGCQTYGLLDQWVVGPMGCQTNVLSDQWVVRKMGSPLQNKCNLRPMKQMISDTIWTHLKHSQQTAHNLQKLPDKVWQQKAI